MHRNPIYSAFAVALLTLVLLPATAQAQNCPVGKACYYAPPQPPPPPGYSLTYDMVLAAPTGTISGTYSIAGGAAQTFSAAAGTPAIVNLSIAEATASGYGTIESRNIFVVADRAGLSVVIREINGPWNSSASIKDHSTALGQRFRAGGYTLDSASTPETGHDHVSLYAPLGATVTIAAPPGVVWGDGLGTAPRVISLTAGQTYILRTNGNACGYDLTGALITSDAPIAVLSGGRGWGNVSCRDAEPTHATACGDDGLDNLIPTSGLGTLYAVDAYPARDGDRVTVVADVDGTEVRVDGTLQATIDAGERFRFAPITLTTIATSAPAYVFQDAGLTSCEHGMSIIPPLSFASTGGGQSLAFDVFGTGQVSVFLPTTQVASLLVDGVAPVSPITDAVPGVPDVSRVRVSVSGGNHSVSASGDLQVGMVSAFSGTGLFAYYNRFRVPGCGDDTQSADEACDDGNVVDGDGCSATCRIEIGYGACTVDTECVANGRCDMDSSLCVARCNVDTDCDDGDACSADSCNTTTGSCEAVALSAGDACDDGLFCTANTFCNASGECLGDAISCAAPNDACDFSYCDEDANSCVDVIETCSVVRQYFFGVVATSDPVGLGSVRCWIEAGAVECLTSGGELEVGPPMCQ